MITSSSPPNPTLFQSFEWHTTSSPAHSHYARLTRLLPALSKLGITSLWLPPGCKANNPKGNGYDIYDLWDLGEYEQKGARSTKWGSKGELHGLIERARAESIDLIWDAVINHKTGGDAKEETWAVEVDKEDRRYEICPPKKIEAWLRYDFPARERDGMKYSKLKWRAEHFNGVDWDDRARKHAIYKIIDDPTTLAKPFVQPRRPPPTPTNNLPVARAPMSRWRFIRKDPMESKVNSPPARRPGKGWADDVDKEHGNNDYLMFSNIDYTHPEVRADVMSWGRWMVEDIGMNGFRLDAVQHFSSDFTRAWIQHTNNAYRGRTGRDIFIVGEVWSGEVQRIFTWLNAVQQPSDSPQVYAYDAPLLYNFSRISQDVRKRSKNADLRTILRESLLFIRPEAAVTLVTNHDTQPGQTMQTPMARELKMMWYAFILLRKEGVPCVFWGDLFGTEGPHAEAPAGMLRTTDGRKESLLAKLLMCRRHCAYGEQKDYFLSARTLGWTRSGPVERPGSGCVVLLHLNFVPTVNEDPVKMKIGAPNDVYTDILSSTRAEVKIDAHELGAFPVSKVLSGVSVFVRKGEVDLLRPPEGLFDV